MSIKKDFVRDFGRRKVGTIEGGDGQPVTVGMISLSTQSSTERNNSYGCPPGQRALLVEWLPENLVIGSDTSSWVVFPRMYQGTPVYYKRGTPVHPYSEDE